MSETTRLAKVEEIVRDHFYPGPVAGSTARLVKALDAYIADEVATLTRERDEAREALKPFAWIGQWLFARDLPDDTPMVTVQGLGKPFYLTRGMFNAAHTARQSKEGGE